MDLPVLFTLWLVQGSIAAYYAKRKGRNPYLWFAIGCFFGIFGIFALFFIKKPKKEAAPTATPAPVRKSLPYRQWYYLDQDTKQNGPISTSALEMAWEEGKINESTYVWFEGMENWKRWQDVCQEHGVERSAKC